ncbi:SpoIIE family protein phosphatase [Desulfopila sp. IMCC35008]|uniref:SpoIIE family protein phosphatase n=1 Tax=Desulfopila sp. IMCC35008 TaxID=2653858 RepID=UPI0013D2F591|nr:SpoIIE family protein phosphatase [Desulfopila sp. IMCC35008]
MEKPAEKRIRELEVEIEHLRCKTAEIDELKAKLLKTEKKVADLQLCERQASGNIWSENCQERMQTLKALKMSRLIVEKSPVILFRRRAGERAKLEYVSENLSQFGYSPDEFLDGSIQFRDIVYHEDRERVSKEISRYAEEDVEEYTMYYRCVTRDGDVRWVMDKTSVVRDEDGNKTHNQGVLFDITERKLAQDALKKSEQKYRRIVETAAEGFVLMDVNLKITDVNKAYCRMLGYTRDELIGKTTMDIATEEFKAYFIQNRDEVLAQEYRVFEASALTKSGKTIPLIIHGSTLRDDAGTIIGHMAFVTDMTVHKQALMLASEVQKSLLPRESIRLHGFDIAGRNVSCDEVGGDYFDFIFRRQAGTEPLNVAVGDISGHGVDSALLMTTARAFLRMRASQPGSISDIISAMNSHLVRDVSDSGRFMTLFYLSIDPVARELGWVRAGHDPALLFDSDSGEFEELKGAGIALGVEIDISYGEYRKKDIHEGQIIAIGTDGLWEASNNDGEMFGRQRYKDVIRKNAGKSAEQILNAVYDELNLFTLGKRPEDDVTLVVIKVGEGVE